MSYLDYDDNQIETLVDGMINVLKRNLVAHTFLTADASAGDTVLTVDNALRFSYNEDILIMDNNSVFDPSTNTYSGFEFHKIKSVTQGSTIELQEPLQQNFLMSNSGRLQKTIRRAILYEKDVLYGDRSVIPADYIAICVEPNSLGNDWRALRLLENEFSMDILVYVKYPSEDNEEWAMRVCQAYATAIYNLLLENIHLDLVVDEVRLKFDADAGDNSVKIPLVHASDWPPDECQRYEVKDNNNVTVFYSLIEQDISSSSSLSSVSSESSSSISSSESTQVMTSSQSSNFVPPGGEMSTESSSITESYSSESSSSGSISSSSFSSSSPSSLSNASSVSSESSSETISESTSSHDDYYEVFLSGILPDDFKVDDHAVLRRRNRYFFDSRVSSIKYGEIQKGSAMLKAARLSWFGKETKTYNFPQIGKGGNIN